MRVEARGSPDRVIRLMTLFGTCARGNLFTFEYKLFERVKLSVMAISQSLSLS